MQKSWTLLRTTRKMQHAVQERSTGLVRCDENKVLPAMLFYTLWIKSLALSHFSDTEEQLTRRDKVHPITFIKYMITKLLDLNITFPVLELANFLQPDLYSVSNCGSSPFYSSCWSISSISWPFLWNLNIFHTGRQTLCGCWFRISSGLQALTWLCDAVINYAM